MKHTPDAYSYRGTQRNKITTRPHCSISGLPGIAVEGPGAAFWIDLESVEPFIEQVREAAAGTRRNRAVARRPWSPKAAA